MKEVENIVGNAYNVKIKSVKNVRKMQKIYHCDTELPRTSVHLTLDPSNSPQTSFHLCLALVPVTGPANVQQTGSQLACRTRHLVLPLVARSDSSWSTFVTSTAQTVGQAH